MRKALFLLVVASLAFPGTEASAQGHARERVRAGEVLPLDQLLPQIRRAHPGSFYDAEGPFPDSNGGYHYRLKWLTPEGRVIWLDTDARTGRVVGSDRNGSDHEPARKFRDRDDYGDRDAGRPGRDYDDDARDTRRRERRDNGDSGRGRENYRDNGSFGGYYDQPHDRWPDGGRDSRRNGGRDDRFGRDRGGEFRGNRGRPHRGGF